MNSNTIAIVIPAYNRAHVISKTLESIIAQEYQEWECIIADDHSTDNTMQIIRDYSLKDPRIKVYENERKKGAQGARNTAILHSTADWICIFDSDDYMYPNYLTEMMDAITPSADIVVCHSEVKNVISGEKKHPLTPICLGDIEDNLFSGAVYVPNNQTLIRKSKLEEIGLLDEDCPSMQEWDTHIRLSKIAKYVTIPKVLVTYFVGGSDAISSDGRREVRGRMYILKKHISEWRKRKYVATDYCIYIIRLSFRTKDYLFILKTICEVCWLCPFLIPYGSYRALTKLYKIIKKTK